MNLPVPLRLRFVAPAGVVLAGGVTLAVEPVALTLVALATLAILVPLQAWTYMRYRRAVRAEEASAGEWVLDTLGTGGALLIGYLAVVSSIWLDAADWPSVGTLEWPVLVLACIGLAFQLVLLGHWTFRRKLPLRRWGWRALAVTAGLALSVALEAAATRQALERVGAHHATLLEALGSSATPCEEYRRYVQTYSGNPSHRPRSLHFGGGRYVLTFAGGSADIDGSTVVFDSRQPGPTLFHNDDRASRRELAALQDSLQACEPAAGDPEPHPPGAPAAEPQSP